MVTPEKVTQQISRSSIPGYSKPRSGEKLVTWESGDASPMPDEGILRDFDLDPRYGPCCTISRKDRWLRASGLGLNPPPNILDFIDITNQNESVLDCHLRQISTSGNFR